MPPDECFFCGDEGPCHQCDRGRRLVSVPTPKGEVPAVLKDFLERHNIGQEKP